MAKNVIKKHVVTAEEPVVIAEERIDTAKDNQQNAGNNLTETKQADPSGTALGNSKLDEKERDPNKALEEALIMQDRAKQSADMVRETIKGFSRSEDDSFLDPIFNIRKFGKIPKAIREVRESVESLARDLNVDIDEVSKSVGVDNISAQTKPYLLIKVHKKLVQIAEERVAAARASQQEAQANYTKAEEEAAKRKAESKPAPKAQKVAESTRNQLTEVTTKEQEAQAETETKKDKTEDPLKKAEELEQKKYQTPVDIKKFSNDLNRFVIQAYLNGDFGKKSSPNAIATMGFFILDKIGAALVNASEVARGMSPSAKSQWGNILDKQTELLGKRITANWFLSLSREQQEALIRSGVISGTTAKTIYETVNTGAVDRAEQKDVLEISKLSQEQKGVAQSNFNALLARKAELQTLITQLKSDQGWEVYAQAMNAVVGTAKGLSSLGVTDDSSSSSQKGFSDTLSANVSTGSVTKAFVSGGVSNNSTWNNSSAKALSKSNSLSQDALALSKFKSGEDYANATREAKKEANKQLIKRLEGQIEIIDKCIDSWGKDLGL